MVDDQEDSQGRDGEKILKDLCLLSYIYIMELSLSRIHYLFILLRLNTLRNYPRLPYINSIQFIIKVHRTNQY